MKNTLQSFTFVKKMRSNIITLQFNEFSLANEKITMLKLLAYICMHANFILP